MLLNGRQSPTAKRKAAMQGETLLKYYPSEIPFPEEGIPGTAHERYGVDQYIKTNKAIQESIDILYRKVDDLVAEMDNRENEKDDMERYTSIVLKSLSYGDTSVIIGPNALRPNDNSTCVEGIGNEYMLPIIPGSLNIYPYKLNTSEGEVTADLDDIVISNERTIDVVIDLNAQRKVSFLSIRSLFSKEPITYECVIDGNIVASSKGRIGALLTFPAVSLQKLTLRIITKDSATNPGIINITVGTCKFYTNAMLSIDDTARKFRSAKCNLYDYDLPEQSNINVSIGIQSTTGSYIMTGTDSYTFNVAEKVNIATGSPYRSNNVAYLSHQVSNYAIEDSIVVLRNCGTQNDNRTTVYGDTLGWSKFDNFYVTYVYNSRKKAIDIGNKSIIVNGQPVSGIVELRQGISYIAFHKRHWKFLPLNATERDDSEYPYNIRYLIEGHRNINMYSGVDIYAGIKCRRATSKDVIYGNENSLINFAYKDNTIYVNGFEGSTCNEDVRYETFAVMYVEDKFPTPQILRAEIILSSSNEYVTPTIKGVEMEYSYDVI